jgi:hypothetical protein
VCGEDKKTPRVTPQYRASIWERGSVAGSLICSGVHGCAANMVTFLLPKYYGEAPFFDPENGVGIALCAFWSALDLALQI